MYGEEYPPLLVNPLAPVREYLGDDYPFYLILLRRQLTNSGIMIWFSRPPIFGPSSGEKDAVRRVLFAELC